MGFMGPVGSGKSYIANMFARKLKAILIRTDDIRVQLREHKKPYTNAPRIAARLRDQALAQGKSIIMDFDAVLPRRQKELAATARRHSAHFFLIRIDTPEPLILQRLRAKHYTKKELFKNAEEAIRVYHIRKKLHTKQLQARQNFVINNAKPPIPQIQQIIKKIKDIYQ